MSISLHNHTFIKFELFLKKYFAYIACKTQFMNEIMQYNYSTKCISKFITFCENIKQYNFMIDEPVKYKFHDVYMIITNYLNTINNYLNQLFQNHVTDILSNNYVTDIFTLPLAIDGIHAIGGNNIDMPHTTAKFSQNILYSQNYCKELNEYLLYSIYINMLISIIEPGEYIFYKTRTICYILSSNKMDSNTFLIPSDIFFTRKKYPYLIKNNDVLTITYRKGRMLHPLSQITTRGLWNFIAPFIHKIKESHLIEYNKYSVNIFNVCMYPESSIYNNTFHSNTHWTKSHNVVSEL